MVLKVARSGPNLINDADPYPLWCEGEYEYMRCIESRVFKHPLLKRWTCRLAFVDMSGQNEGTVFAFLNLGDGSKPPGRLSRYFREWVIACGDHPRRRDRMTPRMFEGKIFRVKIRTVTERYDQGNHPEGMQYSVVAEILQRTGP